VIGSTKPQFLPRDRRHLDHRIRGTDGSLTYDPVTQAVIAAVSAGALGNGHPARPADHRRRPVRELHPGTAPTIPAPTAQATAAVQQVLNSLASQSMPINTPVVVAASARAAAAQANAKQLAAQAAAKPGDTGLQLARSRPPIRRSRLWRARSPQHRTPISRRSRVAPCRPRRPRPRPAASGPDRDDGHDDHDDRHHQHAYGRRWAGGGGTGTTRARTSACGAGWSAPRGSARGSRAGTRRASAGTTSAARTAPAASGRL